MYRLRRIWKPELFQGGGKSGNYFEGWYFKCIDKDLDRRLAFIPGISYARNDPHAFVQVFDGNADTLTYHRYPLSDFEFSTKLFRIRIGKSFFSLRRIDLDLGGEEGGPQGAKITGSLSFDGIVPWPVRLFSPGAMGWYRFAPAMENYHGILSLNHSIDGRLEINGTENDFSGGKGYIEKDWGSSFPKSYIWAQSNHFPDYDVSVTVSVARIPWMGRTFTGQIIGVFTGGKFYSFSTYSGGRLTGFESDTSAGEGRVRFRCETKRHAAAVTLVKKGGVDLKAPVSGEMAAHTHESLDSVLIVELTDRQTGVPIYSGTGAAAGMEFQGDIRGLFS